MRAALLFLLLFFSLHSTAYAQDRFSVTLSGQLRGFIKSEKGERFAVNISTPEGIDQFFFKNVSTSDTDVLLFQGQRRRRTSGLAIEGASADVIGRQLRVIFYSKRNTKLFTVIADIRPLAFGASRLKGRVSHFSRWKKGFRCANHASSGIEYDRSVSSSASQLVRQFQPIYNPPRLITVSTDADYEYFLTHGDRSKAEIRAVINAVEAIYARQLGIRFKVVNQKVFNSVDQPYSSQNAAGLLLQFAIYTNSLEVAPQADLFHLFTGKSLDSGIIGAAFLGSICKNQSSGQPLSFGLTQNVGTAIKALVTAHEFGHKLNARHPEEVLTPAPADSLMTGWVQPANDTFSDFSLGEISSYVDQFGTCLGPALPELGLKILLKAGKRPSRLDTRFLIRRLDNIGKECQITFLASTARRKLKSSSLKPVEVLNLGADRKRQSLKATMPARLRRSRPIFFRAAIVCEELENFSAIRRINFSAGANSAPTGKAWIRLLKGKLSKK